MKNHKKLKRLYYSFTGTFNIKIKKKNEKHTPKTKH